MSDSRVASLLIAARLKSLPRTGWVRKNIAEPESVAAHSWGISFLVLNTLPPSMDMARALQYATLHDLAEAITGDLTPMDGVSKTEKYARERDAMDHICAGLERGPDLYQVWENYERQLDPESRFVRQVDRLDMALQATFYAAQTNADLSEFLASAEAEISHPALAPIMKAMRTHYQEIKAAQSTHPE